jgi:glutamyl endopeptidase
MARTRVADSSLAPFSYICLIEMYRVNKDGTPVSFVNRSTGFLIAPNVIVTAGHSLHEKETQIQRLELYPRQNDQVKTSLRTVVESPDFEIRKVPEYNNPYCYVKDDFGVIILKQEVLPDWTRQHFDWPADFYLANSPATGQPIHIAGYPIDQPDFELWTESGKVVETTDRCLLHPFITTKRNSGSPIWTFVNGQPRVVAIHVSGNAASCGAKPKNRPFGSAVLITQRVYDTIQGWIDEAIADCATTGRSFRLAI